MMAWHESVVDPAECFIELVTQYVSKARTSTERGFEIWVCMLIAQARRDYYATPAARGHRVH